MKKKTRRTEQGAIQAASPTSFPVFIYRIYYFNPYCELFAIWSVTEIHEFKSTKLY